MKKENTILVLFLLVFTMITAQHSVVTSGGDYTTEAGSFSFTIGQALSYENINSSDAIISEGVQQAYKIFENNQSKNLNNRFFTVKLYPNPTPDLIEFEIEDLNLENVYYLIMDAKHNQLHKAFITEKITKISLGQYNSATYFIHLVKNGTPIGGYTVIKK